MFARCPRTKAGQAAFSLIEVLVSITVFTLVSGAVVTSLTLTRALNNTNRETILAAQAAESALENLKATDFSEVFERYNATAADDPAGPEASPGLNFAVSGLAPLADDADGMAGRIEFPGDGLVLREDAVDAELGMPRDLDGDGLTDAADHADDYRILPVRAVIEWRAQGRARRFELVTVLNDL